MTASDESNGPGLKELAMAATPRGWIAETAYRAQAANGGYYAAFIVGKRHDGQTTNVADVCNSYNMVQGEADANAAYIAAANPAAVLALIEERDALRAQYQELLYGVARVVPGESRHQTALRYIMDAERIDSSQVGKSPN